MANFEVVFLPRQLTSLSINIISLISEMCVVYNNKHHITGEVISKPHKREREKQQSKSL